MKSEQQTVSYFWSCVQVSDSPTGRQECWPWQGAKHPKGFGWIYWHGRQWLAHRLAAAFSGVVRHDVLPGVVVRQRCKNKLCCNPTHLYTTPK